MMERIQKVIANSGVCSRRKAEELLINNKVKVNGKIVNELGYKVKSKDIIEVNGKIIRKEDKEYFLLNKPRGVISSTSDEKNRTTVVDLIDTDKKIFPVGRLDYDTTGLILLTNDGEFSNIITHPKNKIEKEYVAKIDGVLNKELINICKKGIVIDNRKVYVKKIKTKKVNKSSNTSIITITICDGKNHEVKKILNHIGFNCLKLKRERIAFFTLNNLGSSKYRKLNPKEVGKVYSLKKINKKNEI